MINEIYRAMNEKLSRDKWDGNLLRRTWSAVTHVVAVDETTMSETVEEVCFEVSSSFYSREKIIE